MREEVYIERYKAMRRSTTNPQVLEQLELGIQQAEKAIRYLQSKMVELQVSPGKSAASTTAGSGGSGETGGAEAATGLTLTTLPKNFTRLTLLKDDNKFMGPLIQQMLPQLEFKLSLEQQYKAGTVKLQHLYQEEGDRRSRADADANLRESAAKIALLTRALKRYADMNIEEVDEKVYEEMNTPNARRPFTGTLHVTVHKVENVDHTLASPTSETMVSMRIENQVVAHTRPSRQSVFNEEFHIAIDKANEIEFVVHDADGEEWLPVALIWMRISDIVEAIRRKRIGMESETGWANADTIQAQHSDSASSSTLVSSNGAPSSNATGTTLSIKPTGSTVTDSLKDPTVEGWFILEPVGRIYLRLGFDKSTSGVRPVYARDGLGRQNAVRKYDETQEVKGHEFAHIQLYNIMRCPICTDFMTYPYQCQECNFACHRKCVSKVVTRCMATSSAEDDADEQLNHRIPHRFEAASNMRANWCCHCGSILPLGKKNVRKCGECGIMCHVGCMKYVPNFCGMPMEMASQIISEIKSTRIRQATKAAAGTKPWQTSSPKSQTTQVAPSTQHKHSQKSGLPYAHQQQLPQVPYKPYASGRITKNLSPAASPAPSSRTEPIRRKQVGSAPLPPIPGSKQEGKWWDEQQSAEASLPKVSSTASFDQSIASQTPPILAPVPQGQQIPQSLSVASDLSLASQLPHVSQTPQAPQVQAPETTEVSEAPSKASEPPQASKASQQPPSIPPPQVRPPVPEPRSPPKMKAPEAPTLPKQPKAQDSKTTTTMPDAAAAAAAAVATAQRGSSNNAMADLQAAASAALTQQRRQSDGPIDRPYSMVEPAGSKRRRRKVGLDDFSFLAVLGKGNFGKVMLAESKQTKKLYAIKVLKKNFIIENREVESTRSEKRVFLIANRERHPFLINLFACFQTENRIYFVMDFISGGDLMHHIQKERFSAKRAKYYAAEVLLALKHFHDNDVIYRDLKLDNILLTLDGHIKVADYGLCKEDMGFGKTTGTFCGTPDFIAPEILLDQKYGRSVDWWALGVLMYQMLLGKSPFRGKDEDEIYDAILSDEPLYPIHMQRDSVSILQQLLTRDPQRRLGSGPRDALEIMEHPYFADIDFDALLSLKIEPPYRPEIDSPTDVRFFDTEFTSECPALTPMNSTLTPNMQEQFRGFSYMNGDVI